MSDELRKSDFDDFQGVTDTRSKESHTTHHSSLITHHFFTPIPHHFLQTFRLLLIATCIGLASPLVRAQTTTPPRENAPVSQPVRERKVGEPATLVFWNRNITVFRSYFDQLTPAERATRAADRLADLPEVASEWRIAADEVSSGLHSGLLITVNGQVAFAVLTDDLDSETNETLKDAADRATSQLRVALEARSQQRRVPVLLRGIGLSVAATLLLLLGLFLVVRFGYRMLRPLDKAATTKAHHLKLGFLDLQPLVMACNRALARLTIWAAAIALLYFWLTFVLLRFPYSQPWGQQLGTFLINLFQKLGSGALRSIPGMFTVVVIFLLARVAARVISGIFSEVEKGDLVVPWLDADTARATRRLVVVLVWIFAVTVAYPYVPGSSTDAFKGVSVFIGLMVSLGSAGLVNQVMSGLVVVYSRALKPGEFVRVGDDLGTVTEIGTLSTKILTRKREEITIPNAVLVGKKTVNYSRHAAGEGAVVGTTLTIGYDAPWRLVHKMLLQAAAQTAGVRKDPAPRVWQKALSDFYIEYELVVNLDKPEERTPILSELHTHIQDAFNEQGVQIMAPHFESQPHERVVVPKSQWFPPPATE